MPAAYAGSPSQAWASSVHSAVAQLLRLQDQMASAKRPEQLAANRAQMQAVISQLRRDGQKWAEDDLPATYRDSYREFGKGAVPKNELARAYRQRAKSKAGVTRLNSSLTTWANQTAKAEATAKAAGGLNKRYREITKALTQHQTGRTKLPSKQVAALQAEGRKVKGQLDQLEETTSRHPGVQYTKRRGKLKGVQLQYMPAEEYANVLAESGHKYMTNYGFLAGLKTGKNIDKVWVSDGVACGLTRHDDPEKVHGRQMPLETMLTYPIAHPHCQRSFGFTRPKGGPKGAAAVSQKVKYENVAKRIQELLRQEQYTKPHTMSDLLTYAKVVGQIVYRVNAFARSPFTRRFATDILANAGDELGPNATKFLQKIVGFDTRNKNVLSAYGKQLGVATEEELQARVMQDADRTMSATRWGAPTEQIKVPEHVRLAMGVSKTATREDLFNAYRDYNDYAEYKLAQARPWQEQLERDILRHRAVEEITGAQPTAALQYHLSNPTSERSGTAFNILLRAARRSFGEDQEFLRRELIRATSELLPSPFPRTAIGNFRFSIGFTQKGRTDLAVKIYDSLRATPRWSEEDLRWAEQLGMQLPGAQEVMPADIVKALLPRITWEPGDIFGASVGLENGKIVPLVRVYPPGAWRKWLSFDSRLRAGALEEFVGSVVSGVRDGSLDKAGIRALLLGSGEDAGLVDQTINNIWFWRNGPVNANLRFYGGHLDSYGVKLFADNDVARLTHRFKSGAATVAGIDADTGEKLFYINSDGDIVRWGSHQTDLVILPTRIGGLSLQVVDGNITAALARFHMWSGNLMSVSKDTRYGYDILLDWVESTKGRASNAYRMLTSSEARSVRTWDDLTSLVRDLIREDASLHSLNKASGLGSAAEVLDTRGLPKAFVTDVDQWIQALRARVPNATVPDLVISDTLSANHEMFYDPRNGKVFVSRHVVDNWTEYQKLRSRAVDVGLFPAGTYDRAANFYHEGAHGLIDQLSARQYRNLWGRVGNAFSSSGGVWPGGVGGSNNFPFKNLTENKFSVNSEISAWMHYGSGPRTKLTGEVDYKIGAIRKKIRNSLGGYAARSPEEFIAEAWTEYMTSVSPRPIAQAVGQYLEALFGGRVVRIPLGGP